MSQSYLERMRVARQGRAHHVQRLVARLEDQSFPRLQMSLVVAMTGGSGLLASFLMLKAGIESMVLRYPLALIVAYAVFMLLMWIWLLVTSRDFDELAVEGLGHSVDVADVLIRSSSASRGSFPTRGPGFESGGGGDFGGGGASASFDSSGGAAMPPVRVTGTSQSWAGGGSSGSSSSDAGGFFSDLDVRLLLVALAIGIALASLYVVYIAPVLFAELLFDGVLSYRLYAHLKKEERQHWLETAFKKTAWPFIATGLLLVAVAAGMSSYAPGAKSLGEVLKYTAATKQ